MEIWFYRKAWLGLLRPGWKAGLVLLMLWSIPQFVIVLGASRSGNYQWVSLLFLSMWLAPYIMLTRLSG